MITNRVFLLDWPGLEHYFTSPFFDWTYDADLVETGRSSDTSAIYQMFWGGLADYIMTKNADNAYFKGNRGASSAIYERGIQGRFEGQIPPPFNGTQLNTSTHFGFVVNALLQPTKEVQDAAAAMTNFTLDQTESMIATNVRTGDDSWDGVQVRKDAGMIAKGRLSVTDNYFFRKLQTFFNSR